VACTAGRVASQLLCLLNQAQSQLTFTYTDKFTDTHTHTHTHTHLHKYTYLSEVHFGPRAALFKLAAIICSEASLIAFELQTKQSEPAASGKWQQLATGKQQ